MKEFKLGCILIAIKWGLVGYFSSYLLELVLLNKMQDVFAIGIIFLLASILVFFYPGPPNLNDKY